MSESLDCMNCHTGQLLLRCIALTAAVTVAATIIAPCAMGQTLAQPNPPPNKPSPPPSKKFRAGTRHEESCSAFGTGFVKVPGTDACVRIGGWVTIEGTSR
jgi:hypothetical protein